MARSPLNCLSICSGVGGLELALPTRTVCYVEREAYAAAVLAARMEEGHMDKAPVWDDLATFRGKPWRGVVDCVTAGFPCQPFSVAGSRKGEEDERWIWPDIVRIIREVEPGAVFLENVPGLVSGGGLGTVLGDLAECGFNAEWGVFSAAASGAPHLRKRVFILAAHSNREYGHLGRSSTSTVCGERPKKAELSESHSDRGRREEVGQQDQCGQQRARRDQPDGCDLQAAHPEGTGLPQWQGGEVSTGEPGSRAGDWWVTEPSLGRVADGVAHRVDRLRALGNGVVPAVAARAWRDLWKRLN